MKPLKLQLALLLLFAMISSSFAQNKGKITGVVKDAQTHAVIPFATVSLSRQDSRATIAATQTDTTGGFALDALPPGAFKLHVSCVGYDSLSKESIVIGTTGGPVNIEEIVLTASKNNNLNEVTVSGRKPTIQNKDERKIFSVDQSLVSVGGTAADVLKNVPTLQIDASGNVSLRGSTGVTVLVDGKPSLIAGGDVVQLLQSIPASAIDRIEIIANPSAKYDAEGEHIINIVLKKNSRPGFNGAAALSGGTRENYSGSANLGYETGKVNVYGNYSLRNGNSYSNGFQYLTFLDPTNAEVFSNEFFPSTTRNKIQNLKTGIDYSLAPKSVLSFSAGLNLRNTHRNEFLDIANLDAAGVALNSTSQNNTINNNGKNYVTELDFSRHFNKPKEELTFNLTYSQGSFQNGQVYQGVVDTGTTVSYPAPLQSTVQNHSSSYILQADYVLPIGSDGQLSAGYKSQISMGKNDQYAYNLNAAGSTPLYEFTDFFSSNTQVHALYLNYQNQWRNFNYQLGVRGEDAHVNATYLGYNAGNNLFSTPISVPTEGLYPSIVLTQKLQNGQQLQLSYNNRISRPTPAELNSSVDFSDPTNYSTGNPKLLPETINSFELDYNRQWQNVSFTSGLYYTGIGNVIKHVQTVPADEVITTIPENLQHSGTAGLELIGHFDPVKALDFTANANIFFRQNDAAPQYGIAANNGLAWDANLTANLAVAKGLSVQVHTDYRSAIWILQDYNLPTFGLDAGAKYDFSGNRASLSLNSVDVFNSRDWAFVRNSDNLLLNFERRYEASRATLTFTWRFGKSIAPKPARKKEDNPDKRVDSGS